MKPTALHILAALSEGEAHGYGVMQRVRERSNGEVSIATGSLYRHLSALIDDGLVLENDARKPGDDPRRGTYYKLSARGKDALSAERRRLAALVASLGPRHSR